MCTHAIIQRNVSKTTGEKVVERAYMPLRPQYLTGNL